MPGPYATSPTRSDAVAYGKWCLEETARIIEREGAETIGAMFVEPVQGAGGVICRPKAICRRFERFAGNGILFVADEVISGFGRLGAWFGSELWSLDPDLMSLAKGITSGYLPLGATMVCNESRSC